MRTVTTTTEVFKYEELTEEQKLKALENLWDINVSYDWWNFTYEDAKMIELEITGFDIGRANSIDGNIECTLTETCGLIFENHGEQCDTVQTAKRYWALWADLVEKYSDGVDTDTVTYENEYEFDQEADELEEEFRKEILQDYLNILRSEYDYLLSKEAIEETIEANEYEFTADGELF